MKDLSTLESRLVRFGVRVLRLSNSQCALSVHRAAIEEAALSDTGRYFYDSGPADCIELVQGLLSAAMDRGELPPSDPRLAACQFMALVTAETRSRLLQPTPPRLTTKELRSIACRAAQSFLLGAADIANRPALPRPGSLSRAG